MAPSPPGKVAALIVAGGRGHRAGGDVPKQYRKVDGASILARSIRPFLDHPKVASVTVVIHREDRALYDAAAPPDAKVSAPVLGGATRQESVRLGLEALAAQAPDAVLIHDAVRPFVDGALISRVVDALSEDAAVLPALPVPDTLKRIGGDRHVLRTLPRDGVFAAQTPQGFRFAAILDAHRKAATDGGFTDDSAIAEAAGIPVRIVAGDSGNAKLTTTEDIEDAERRLVSRTETRVGSGYDVHAFGGGDQVTLGGVRIPHDKALVGHSDADVVLHAVTDAILGAVADADIGQHFPPSDPSLRGASSDRFLSFAVEQLRARRGSVVHLDVTVIAEAPLIGPHRSAMRQRIAEICGIDIDRVSVKATTNERIGFVGRGEGIAALATATVRLPFNKA
jgi:2-C-methyl-D-erythritol 4-phosphate cytidylyltransferase/2-C-methyl-D-erythritol 2,4-cyclodiphosphate synthase